MSFRFRLLYSVCVFAVLVSVLVVAQTDSASFAGHGARALKQSARLSSGVQTPALSFATAQQYSSGGNGANAVAVADLNGDGRLDLVVTNFCAYSSCTTPGTNIGVLLQNPDGTFQTAVVYASGGLFADSVAVADVNGDGHPDIVVANCGSASNSCVSVSNSGNVAVLIGNGDGTFQTAVTYTTGGGGFGATSVAVADLGNGHLDLIVAGDCSGGGCVGVFLGKGDGTFGAETANGSGGVTALAVAVADVNGDRKPDVVVANECTDSNCTSSTVGVLIGNGDGTFQTAAPYDSGGLFADSVVIVDVNGDGKTDVIVANSSTSTSVDDGDVGVLLGNGDGTFKPAVAYPSGAFGAAAVAVADVNGDGKPDVVVANCSGTASSCVGALPGNVGVLLGNGDGTFQTAVSLSPGGNTPFGIAVGDVNGDGRPDIVVANCFSSACGQGQGEVGVLINTTSPWLRYASLAEQADYFGEGTADFTVWRPSTGTWYSIDGSGHSLTERWGSSTDIPVIGDYDDDGKTDVAVWRPSNGTWFIIPSSTGKAFSKQWGTKGDVPVPGDYDGDGKTDIAVWRPSNGIWYIIQSSNHNVVQKQWGKQGDVPVPGDYDGDGKTDIAVWRPSNGIWYIIQSSTGKVVTQQWGAPTDKPVPADYDGDGKTDVAVWRPSGGIWYVIQSSTKKVVTQRWGTTGDVPVPRDYDGDLKADFAVWRPSSGIWWVIQSSNNNVINKQWGASTDIPVNKPVGQ